MYTKFGVWRNFRNPTCGHFLVVVASVVGSRIVVIAVGNCGVLKVPGNLALVTQTFGLIGGGNVDDTFQFTGVNNTIVDVDVINLQEVNEDAELLRVNSLVLNVVLLVGERAGVDGGLPVQIQSPKDGEQFPLILSTGY